jgi:tol-pal system protein YbgF
MKRSCAIRKLTLLGLVLLLSACSQTYSYVPSVSQPAAPPPEAGAETPAGAPAATPMPAPPPDLAQQVHTLTLRVQQLETRLAELEAAKAGPAATTRREKAAQKVAKVPAPSTSSYPQASPAAADKSYNEGLKLYHSKKYGPARTQFYQYMKAHPQGAKAPEARYYLADSFYQEGKYREAAVEFNKMASQFPKSILAPAALLRQALAYKQQQQTPNYHSTLRKLVKAYPNSPEAKEAQKWLKEEKKEAAH